MTTMISALPWAWRPLQFVIWCLRASTIPHERAACQNVVVNCYLAFYAPMAFDTLFCPETSCECERVFSFTKKLISPERNRLADDTIEALECLKAWFDKRFINKEENIHQESIASPIQSILMSQSSTPRYYLIGKVV
jgi:hypothetical protein